MLSFEVVSAVGAMCYTIYLYHSFCLSIVSRLVGVIDFSSWVWNWLCIAVLGGVLLIPIAIFAYLWFERPFMGSELFGKFKSYFQL